VDETILVVAFWGAECWVELSLPSWLSVVPVEASQLQPEPLPASAPPGQLGPRSSLESVAAALVDADAVVHAAGVAEAHANETPWQ